MSIKKIFKKIWKYIKAILIVLLFILLLPILIVTSPLWLKGKEEERRKTKEPETAKKEAPKPSRFECEETVTDDEGKTPRSEGSPEIDRLFSGLAPEVKEKLKRDYALKHRKPVLMPIVRTRSAPEAIRTAREIVDDEMPVLEETTKREENAKSDI